MLSAAFQGFPGFKTSVSPKPPAPRRHTRQRRSFAAPSARPALRRAVVLIYRLSSRQCNFTLLYPMGDTMLRIRLRELVVYEARLSLYLPQGCHVGLPPSGPATRARPPVPSYILSLSIYLSQQSREPCLRPSIAAENPGRVAPLPCIPLTQQAYGLLSGNANWRDRRAALL